MSTIKSLTLCQTRGDFKSQSVLEVWDNTKNVISQDHWICEYEWMIKELWRTYGWLELSIVTFSRPCDSNLKLSSRRVKNCTEYATLMHISTDMYPINSTFCIHDVYWNTCKSVLLKVACFIIQTRQTAWALVIVRTEDNIHWPVDL